MLMLAMAQLHSASSNMSNMLIRSRINHYLIDVYDLHLNYQMCTRMGVGSFQRHVFWVWEGLVFGGQVGCTGSTLSAKLNMI